MDFSIWLTLNIVLTPFLSINCDKNSNYVALSRNRFKRQEEEPDNPETRPDNFEDVTTTVAVTTTLPPATTIPVVATTKLAPGPVTTIAQPTGTLLVRKRKFGKLFLIHL